MPVTARAAVIALLCLVVHPPRVGAQTESDPYENARFRMGVIRFTPSIALSNVGVDNNVFNEAENPRSDTTAAVGPAVDLWLNMGRSRLSGKTSGQYLYYDKYENQRAWNTNVEARWDLPLSRIAPFVRGRRNNTKDRPGYEIDSRVRLVQQEGGLGTSIRVAGKTTVVVEAGRTQQRYNNQDPALGDRVAQTLDRISDLESVQLRVQLTPLTTFLVLGEAVQDRFRFATGRDSNSLKIAPGFDLRPGALISGRVSLGVRRFDGLDAEMPDYTGFVSNVLVTYIIRATKAELRTSRDLFYSYELLRPYYAQFDAGLTVTQRITTRWDLVGRGGRQSLDYKTVAITTLPKRVDRLWQGGAGIGFRVSPALRVGLDANYYQRNAPAIALRDYEGLRVGASFSYGLNQ